MKIVFLGTPDFAVPSLESLLQNGHNIIGVVSQPDRAKDRKGNLLPTAVKIAAVKNGLKLWQFEKIRHDGVETLKSLNPDIMVTAAYGQILSQEIIDIPKYGIINVHGSLLPKYRGSAPIQWAVMNGERETGVTIMQTAAGLDTGDILSTVKMNIGENETSGELYDRMKEDGAKLLIKTLPLIESGQINPITQDESQATKCEQLNKNMAKIDWALDAKQIHNLVRGMNPWPIAHTFYNGEMLKIYQSEVISCDKAGKYGEVLYADAKNGIVIKCGKDALKIISLQLPNRNKLNYKEFLAGKNLNLYNVLGENNG